MSGTDALTGDFCLRLSPDPGAATKPAILLVPPLFEEANRLRRTLVLTMRALASLGHHCLLPDLPGQGDSLLPNEEASVALWRKALAQLASAHSSPLLVASWRGGSLLDDAATNAIGWWRMAPQGGASIVKTMMRTRIAGDKEAGRQTSMDDLRAMIQQGAVELAGYRLSGTMLAELEAARPVELSPLRQVSVGAGDGQVPGTALWLRAEPGEDGAMAAAMAADISAWSVTCAAG